MIVPFPPRADFQPPDVPGGHWPSEPGHLLSRARYESQRSSLLRVGRVHRNVRRISLGEAMSLVFETATNLRLQIQEELRWTSDPEREARRLLRSARLLVPEPGDLTACLFVSGRDPEVVRRLALETRVEDLGIVVHLPGVRLLGESLEPESTGLGAVSYLRFRRTSSSSSTPRIEWGDPVRSVRLPAESVEALQMDLAGRHCVPAALLPTR